MIILPHNENVCKIKFLWFKKTANFFLHPSLTTLPLPHCLYVRGSEEKTFVARAKYFPIWPFLCIFIINFPTTHKFIVGKTQQGTAKTRCLHVVVSTQ